MAWYMFWFLLFVFTVILGALLYAAFTGQGEAWFKIGLFLLDGVVGWSIKALVYYLFPSDALTKQASLPPKTEDTKELPE